MANPEFYEILRKIECGKTAELSRIIEGKKYTRRFIPKDRLIVLGGGHIAQPLCRMATMLDFSVTVIDDRSSYANFERFPDATSVICSSFRKAISELHIRETDYICVITRGHRWDGDCLREILNGTAPTYLGMIGAARRVSGLLGLLAEEGYETKVLSAIHAPIGLKINALTPAEIAVSICAELVAHRRQLPQANDIEYLHQTNTDMDMLRYLAQNEEPKAMMLVLDSTGSTPVKAGAIMVVNYIGKGNGTIGGGCSEAAIMSRSRNIIGTGTSCVVEVDMSNDIAAEEGMVCGGTMKVLIEDV